MHVVPIDEVCMDFGGGKMRVVDHGWLVGACMLFKILGYSPLPLISDMWLVEMATCGRTRFTLVSMPAERM